MVIVSFIGGSIYVTFSQGLRIWQAAVRQSQQGKEELFFEKLDTELRNAFLYGKSALNGQSQMIEFHALVPQLRGKNKYQRVWKVPAQIRYRFDPRQKLIQKEINFYEKMLTQKSGVDKIETVLDAVTNVNMEYYRQSNKNSSASWTRRWTDTCFPEAIKMTVEAESGLKIKQTRIITIPATGECSDQEESAT
jgi:hypothetical protein